MALTESPVGGLIEVTDNQKTAIRERSDRLAKKIKQMHDEIRQEAHDAVFENLTAAQRAKVRELYGDGLVDRYFEGITLHTLYEHFLYDRPEDPIMKLYPSVELRKSEIEFNK